MQGKTEKYVELISKLTVLKASMSLVRKVFRFGGEIPTLLKIIDRFKQNSIAPVKMMFLQTLSDLFGFVYLLLDHPMYFVKIGFIKSWTPEYLKKWDWWTDFMWLI